MKYPHFFPVSRKCKVPETRKKLEIAYQSRCLEENTKILEELIELRQEQAEMLGYESHAHYIQVHIWYVFFTVFQRADLEVLQGRLVNLTRVWENITWWLCMFQNDAIFTEMKCVSASKF